MHSFECRVYYEDTDLGGIVYYANYLKFIERARSEWVRSLGVDQARMRAETGAVFAVRRIEADYLRPALFEDMLRVTTQPKDIGNSRLVLQQDVWREETLLFTAIVTLVCVGANGRALRIPQVLRDVI